MDELVLQAKKFKVVRRSIGTTGNQPMQKDMIIHPGAAVIIPVMDDGRIVMVENFRWTINRELLELPAGTLEPLETPETCATRELEEETGYSAERIEPLCRFYSSPGIATELMHIFVAKGLKPGQQNLSADEQIKVVPMTVEDIRRAIGAGRIMDGKTIAAILYFAEFAAEPSSCSTGCSCTR